MANLNLNTFPYYDDYSEEKGFHRILFKPGFAVQARELTQLQTMLQEQIRRFGNHVFKDGSVVFGCAESANFNFPYVKLEDDDSFGSDVTDAILTASEGLVVVGQNYGVRALIKKVALGSTGESPNLKTLFVQYLSTGTDNVTTTFGLGETLTIETSDQTFVVAGSSETPIGVGSLFSVGDGIVYANGNFIKHTSQTIVLDRYSASPTKKVGFIINESVANADDDETLLDPAQGSFNYTAPGADRYRLETEIVAVASDEETPEGFYILFDVEDGNIKRKYNVTQYAELNKTLARRTYDESGDYTVRPFPLIVREHLNTGSNGGRYTSPEGGDAGKLVVAVEPGKAYVKGYEHELFSTEYIPTDKAFGVGHETTNQNQPITTGYGSYVTCNTVSGVWPINNADTVNLVQGAATVIGTARVREIEYNGSTYNIYLYDIVMTAAFGLVDKITYATGVASATVVDATAVLQKSGQLAAVFQSPYSNLKTITDASYVYRKRVSSITASGSSFTTTLSSESWAFSAATVSGNLSNDVIVVNESTGAILPIVSATVAGSTLTVTLVSSLGAPTAVTVLGLVRKTVAQNSKTRLNGRYTKINTASHSAGAVGPYSLGVYDVFSVEEVWSATSSGGGDTVYPSDPSVDPLWTNVTDQFVLNDGQRDAEYALASVTPTTAQTSKKLIIKFSYFQHGTSSGYYTVTSYPLPAESSAPTSSQINWEDIPSFVSSSGTVYDLRNSLDFRPTAALTAADSTTVAGATTNPSEVVSTFLTGFTHPAPSDEFIGDLVSHLPRQDRIILDAEGNFSVVKGVPSMNPIRPRQPDNAMTLGFVSIAPFPSLSPQVAKAAGTMQYACRVSLSDNRRYTMRDIGDINSRIDRLEYYTSLSLLEQNTANLLVANAAGEDRFKNGILVDSFVGHNVGNVYDSAYNCSINNGELRPFYNLENIDFAFKAGTDIVRNAADAAIVVRQLTSATAYAVGGVVTSTSGATGTIAQIATVATSPGYRWVRLYLNAVTGTFGENNTITQSSASGVITYSILTTTVLPTALRPSLVMVPSAGSLVTLPYTHRVFARNPHASKTRNAVSQLLFTYSGSVELTPAADIWTDTSRLPDLQVNSNGTADNWETMDRAWGTQWGNWEDTWQGISIERRVIDTVVNGRDTTVTTEITETTFQRQERVGSGITVDNRAVKTNLGTKIVSSSLTPFMRAIVVSFSATRMKPNTRLYAFFDNINITANCRTGSNEFGTPLLVDANGNISGQFRIPSGTFNVGTKTFLLCDNETNPKATDISTLATANFTASGLAVVDQGSIISTQVPQTTPNRQVETREFVVGRVTSTLTVTTTNQPDPIAQTFFISDNQNGAMVSKIDVFFKTKSTTAPITLQIREVVNGYPSETILPFSSVTLHPKDINVSADATSPTPFVFPSPIYMKNDTEYCFVLLPAGNDENYNVWVSELGENQIGTTTRIDKQPYAGVLFVSGNNRTWNAIQSEDVKFTIYQCEFDDSVTGVVDFVNAPVDYLNLSGLSEDFLVGDVVRFTTAGVSTGVGTIKYYDTLNDVAQVVVSSGTVSAAQLLKARSSVLTGTVSTSSTATLLGVGTVFTSEVAVDDILMAPDDTIIGKVLTVVSDVEITLAAPFPTAFAAAKVWQSKTATVDALETKLVTAISPTLGYLDFNNTQVVWQYKIHSLAGIDPISYVSLSTGTTELSTESGVFSNSTTPETFAIRGFMTTEVTNLSPVIDLTKMGSVIIANDVNDVLTDETGNVGLATSKYISRRVVLSDGQESEDLRVYLTANIPSGASVAVYAKMLNDTDSASFESRPWLLLNEAAPVNPTGYKEYVYTIPTGSGTTSSGALTGSGYVYSSIYSGFKTFAVKIVLLSDNAAQIPVIRDMRAIALMV